MRSCFLSFKVKVMKTFWKRLKNLYAFCIFDLEYFEKKWEVDLRKRHLVKSSTLITTKSNKKMPVSHFKQDLPSPGVGLPTMAYGRWYLFRAWDIQKGKGNLSFRSVRRSLTAELTDICYGCETVKKFWFIVICLCLKASRYSAFAMVRRDVKL